MFNTIIQTINTQTLGIGFSPVLLVFFMRTKVFYSWFTIYSKFTTFRIMNFVMFLYRKYFQVFNSIIKFVVVNMMYMFRIKKFPPKMFFHYMSMLKHSVISTHRKVNVSIFANTTLTISNSLSKSNSTGCRTVLSDIQPLFLGTIIRFCKQLVANFTFFIHMNMITVITNVCNIKIKLVTA